MIKKLSLFEAVGIELEYMIVDKTTLAVRPISDRLLIRASNSESNMLKNQKNKTHAGPSLAETALNIPVSLPIDGDFENGRISWSNELVMHVIELKTSGPDSDLATLSTAFQDNIHLINTLLAHESAMLLPGGMHPFMDPEKEKKLWPHDNNEIYSAYDRIFDCKGHGWSNLQSMHINLPFANDEEFRKLHTAVRFLLPILPSLTASSPIIEGHISLESDSRLIAYQQNQKRIPSIAGQVIPEPVVSKIEYDEKILQKIYADIQPYDNNSILQEEWLNSRGAIARFSRNAIEIRILDTQECPAMDIAVAEFIITLLRDLTNENSISFEKQFAQKTNALKSIFDHCVHSAETAIINDLSYLSAWGVDPVPTSAKSLWIKLIRKFDTLSKLSNPARKLILGLIKSGSLSNRIKKALDHRSDRAAILDIYRQLASCLRTGTAFRIDTELNSIEEVS